MDRTSGSKQRALGQESSRADSQGSIKVTKERIDREHVSEEEEEVDQEEEESQVSEDIEAEEEEEEEEGEQVDQRGPRQVSIDTTRTSTLHLPPAQYSHVAGSDQEQQARLHTIAGSEQASRNASLIISNQVPPLPQHIAPPSSTGYIQRGAVVQQTWNAPSPPEPRESLHCDDGSGRCGGAHFYVNKGNCRSGCQGPNA